MAAPQQKLSPLAAAAAFRCLTEKGYDLADRAATNMQAITDLTKKHEALANSEDAKTAGGAAQSKVFKDAILALRTEQYAIREQAVLLDRAGEYATPETDMLARMTYEEHAELTALLERVEARIKAEDDAANAAEAA